MNTAPGLHAKRTAAAASKPILRACVNGVPGGGKWFAPKDRNAAPTNMRAS